MDTGCSRPILGWRVCCCAGSACNKKMTGTPVFIGYLSYLCTQPLHFRHGQRFLVQTLKSLGRQLPIFASILLHRIERARVRVFKIYDVLRGLQILFLRKSLNTDFFPARHTRHLLHGAEQGFVRAPVARQLLSGKAAVRLALRR